MFEIIKDKSKKFSISSVFFLFLMIIPSYLFNYVELTVLLEPHPANAMWIEPSNVSIVKSDDKFNVTVFVNLTQKSYAWQVKVCFNSTFFDVTKLGYTDEIKSNFFAEFSPMPVIPRINNEEGYIIHGETLIGNDERNPGYGSLIWVEFRLKQIPPQNHSTFYFSTPYGIDTFVLTPYFDTIVMESFDEVNIYVETVPASTTSPSTSATGLPPFSGTNILILIVIIVSTVVFLSILMRKRRRKLKKHEKSES